MDSVKDMIGKTPILPRGAAERLHGWAAGLGGGALVALAVALVLALLSFHPDDRSLNTATDGAQNLIGVPGAIAADLLLQAVGLAALFPVLVLAAWGWLVIDKTSVPHAWARILLLIVVMLLGGTALAALPTPEAWPLHSGVGGVSGAIVLDRATGVVESVLTAEAANAFPGREIIAVMAAIGALAGLYSCLALRYRHWNTAMRALGVFGGWAFDALRNAPETWRTFRTERLIEAGKWISARREPKLRVPEESYDADNDDDESAYEAASDAADHAPAAFAPAPIEQAPKAPLVAPRKVRAKISARAQREKQTRMAFPDEDIFHLPPLDLLTAAPVGAVKKVSEKSLEQNARLLESVLADFGVKGEIVKVRPGPVVTLYELEPAPGTKTSRVIGLSDDIARSMSAISVRSAVIPGRNVIGIELPNARREMVYLRELLESQTYEKSSAGLPLVLGKDIGGGPIITDLARMPHLLIAGTTGSGKSVAINTMILSLLYRLPPERCRMIMVDPKMLELSVYDDIPHLLAPVVTDPSKAVVALKWTVREMENRYKAMAQMGVRNITGYNKRLEEARRKGEELTRRVQTGFDDMGQPVFEDQPLGTDPLPYIVVIVDEMADLMLVAGKDIEAAIQRLAQMARAAGIHLIMATQRPSVDVITGTIKANFPTRISFQVTSKIDSRTILGEQGAEQLLGQGDMLYMAGGGRISRVHGPFVSDEEVEEVVSHLKEQAVPDYVESVTDEEENAAPIIGMGDGPAAGGGSSEDALYDQAVAIVAREGKASTSFVQRHLQIGYNRAARIIERMEAEGVVTKANRVGKREVLVGHHGE
ncbi:MAG: DNA translocase FtsK 4TM domain-containing protein [Magnetospiraceae bacterium]